MASTLTHGALSLAVGAFWWSLVGISLRTCSKARKTIHVSLALGCAEGAQSIPSDLLDWCVCLPCTGTHYSGVVSDSPSSLPLWEPDAGWSQSHRSEVGLPGQMTRHFRTHNPFFWPPNTLPDGAPLLRVNLRDAAFLGADEQPPF